MSETQEALIKAHRNNILRYQRLLETSLTDVEHSYIQSRMAEEQSALDSASGQSAMQSGNAR